MRRWGDKKGSAKILVLPHGSGAISKACYFVRITRSRYNLPQGCVPPLLRHHGVVVYLACVRHLLAWRLHAYLTSGIVTLKTCNLFFLKITLFCVPWWFCYQVLICRNAIPPCVINMKMLFHVWNLILFKGQNIIKGPYGLFYFCIIKHQSRTVLSSLLWLCLVRYCLL